MVSSVHHTEKHGRWTDNRSLALNTSGDLD